MLGQVANEVSPQRLEIVVTPGIPRASTESENQDKFTEYEFYFEDGFNGECFLISADSERRTVEPRTQLQTGLALVERLTLADGAEVIIESDELGVRVIHRVESERKYVQVTRTEDGLEVKASAHQPRYA